MNVDDRMGSCRDKGRGGVDEGALCLSWLGCDLFAPRSPHWLALPPGQAQGLHPAPHPPLVPTGPHSVVNIHQVSRFILENKLFLFEHSPNRLGTVPFPPIMVNLQVV